MPRRPPSLRVRKAPEGPKLSNWSKRKSRQERGYGREHDLMRARILVEEPICRMCAAEGRVEPTTIADHIVAKADGGTDDRSNYQGLCRAHHVEKTAAESARGKRR